MEPLIGQADAQAGAAAIIDGSDATFRQDVMEPSQTTPVIVDFWAPWCGPCKQLGPALEKAVTAAGGKVRLVKINIDESPMIAQQLQVQSIPAVFGFVGGRPVDGFAGAQPESAIRDFIARLLKAAGNDDSQDPIEAALEQADAAIEAGDFAMAAGIFGQVLEHDPENFKVAAKLAQAYIKLGEVEAAKAKARAVKGSLLRLSLAAAPNFFGPSPRTIRVVAAAAPPRPRPRRLPATDRRVGRTSNSSPRFESSVDARRCSSPTTTEWSRTKSRASRSSGSSTSATRSSAPRATRPSGRRSAEAFACSRCRRRATRSRC